MTVWRMSAGLFSEMAKGACADEFSWAHHGRAPCRVCCLGELVKVGGLMRKILKYVGRGVDQKTMRDVQGFLRAYDEFRKGPPADGDR